MKKSILRMSALAFVAACMAACSGSDDVTESVTPQQPAELTGNTMHLTATIGSSKGETTRAVAANGVTSWKTGEQVAVYYPTRGGDHATAIATISSSDNNKKTATIEVDLPDAAIGEVKLVYPAARHDGQGGYSTEGIETQDGTLASVSANWDIATATAQMTASTDGTKAVLNGDETVYMQNQLTICKLYLFYNSTSTWYTSRSLNGVYTLEVLAGGQTYTVGHLTSGDVRYVAMLPVTNADITFRVMHSSNGKHWVFENKMTFNRSVWNTDYLGKFLVSDGYLYDVYREDGDFDTKESKGITLSAGDWVSSNVILTQDTRRPVAMIAYVGTGTAESAYGYNHGLAMAVANTGGNNGCRWAWENKTIHSTQITKGASLTTNYDTMTFPQESGLQYYSGTAISQGRTNPRWADGREITIPVTGTSGWFLPSAYQVERMVKTMAKKGQTDGTNLSFSSFIEKGGESTGGAASSYWTCTEYYTSSNSYLAYATNFISISHYMKSSDMVIRSIFAY